MIVGPITEVLDHQWTDGVITGVETVVQLDGEVCPLRGSFVYTMRGVAGTVGKRDPNRIYVTFGRDVAVGDGVVSHMVESKPETVDESRAVQAQSAMERLP